jgi:hypothetical protein
VHRTVGDDILNTPIVLELRVVKYGQFLPSGLVAVGEPPAYEGRRTEDHVRFFTDPGGWRVVPVSRIVKVR